jgi:putative transposase
MEWIPSYLTREQMEERRRQGGRLVKAGRLSQAEIARQLGVSRATVSTWAKRIQQGGLRQLRLRKATGRPTKLNREQQKALLRRMQQGALSAGFATDRWTLSRIQQLIAREFGVVYHPNYLNRLLKRLGWSPQLPAHRAVERDEALIRAWLSRDWTRIKKSAAAPRRDRVFR